MRLVLALVLSLAAPVLAADPPLYPLAVGARWTYKAKVTWQDGDQTRTKELVWSMEVTGVSRQGDLEVFSVTGHPRELAFYEEKKKPGPWYIVRAPGGVHHVLEATKPDEAGTPRPLPVEQVKAELSPDTVEAQPPFTPATMFGDPEAIKATPGRNCWVVGPPAPVELAGVAGAPPGKLVAHTLEFRTNPDTTTVRIVPGLGIVSYEYRHHGTPGDCTLTLSEFRPGK